MSNPNGATNGVVSTASSTVDTGVISTATSYACSYGPAKVAGNYTLSITRSGVHIKNSPFSIYLVPGDIDGPSSYITNVDGTHTKDVGKTYWFTIVTRVRAITNELTALQFKANPHTRHSSLRPCSPPHPPPDTGRVREPPGHWRELVVHQCAVDPCVVVQQWCVKFSTSTPRHRLPAC